MNVVHGYIFYLLDNGTTIVAIVSHLSLAGRNGVILGLGLFGCCATGQTAPTVSGVVETYYRTNPQMRGDAQQLSWVELRGKITNDWSVTWSGYDSNGFAGYDEAYLRYEKDARSIRAGRMRTSFGYSDWSELLYSGFNHRPLVRELNLVGTTKLDRDDSGAEVTETFGPLQLQAAMVKTSLSKAQVGPDALDHGALTAQCGIGRLIVGAEVLSKTDFSEKVYGTSFRYTIPHWIFKGEYFEGVGPGNASGCYVDAIYRIPYHFRTELVGRAEQVRGTGSDSATQLATLGVRQILNRYLTVNVNYSWGNELDYSSYAKNAAVTGWTTQLMFQVQF